LKKFLWGRVVGCDEGEDDERVGKFIEKRKWVIITLPQTIHEAISPPRIPSHE
jgi:hypothetical protein